MKTAEIKEAIRDRIAEQIKPADIEDAILTAVFEFDFRETIRPLRMLLAHILATLLMILPVML